VSTTLQTSPPAPDSPPHGYEDLPWTAYVDALLSWRRFVLTSVAVCWVLILGVGLSAPRQYNCEATLSFPPASTNNPNKAPGIPLPLYRIAQQRMSDVSVLEKGLGDLVDESERRTIAAGLENHVSPLTTGPLGNAQRMTRDDTVIGTRVTYTGQPEEKAVNVVAALTRLCQETVLRALAQEQIGLLVVQVNDETRMALLRQIGLNIEIESLTKQDADLARLAREFPAAEGRQLVDTKEGGQLYLPPTVQLAGLRAKLSEDRHFLRVAEQRVSLGMQRVRFLETLVGRLDKELATSGEGKDTLSLLRGELERFAASPASDASRAAVIGDANSLINALSSFSRTTALVQNPTTRKKSRAPLLAGAAVAAVVVVLGAALLGESWRRLHAAS
jgi:hypothetical protein